jgi:hypothetical protein
MAEDKKQEKKEEIGGVDFFIKELAHMEQDSVKMYTSLSRRIAILEQKGKSSDDPEKMLTNVFIVLMVIQLLPVVVDVLRSLWTPSASSSSSSLSE